MSEPFVVDGMCFSIDQPQQKLWYWRLGGAGQDPSRYLRFGGSEVDLLCAHRMRNKVVVHGTKGGDHATWTVQWDTADDFEQTATMTLQHML